MIHEKQAEPPSWAQPPLFTTKLLGFTCVTLVLLLWAVTFWTHPSPGVFITAAALTIITAIAGVLAALT
jgi:uncharacterized membrane protein